MTAYRVFKQKIEIQVPAKGLFGTPPSRQQTFSFVLPSSYSIIRDGPEAGGIIINSNLDGLTEKQRKFSNIENGIQLVWELSNRESFPVNGREAFIELELKGEPIQQISLSEKYLKLRQRCFEQFYFDGLIATWISSEESEATVKFSDQTICQGEALLVLSMEIAILRETNGDTSDAKIRIAQILNAIDELDRIAELRFGEAQVLDGFFVRDDISGISDPRLGNRFSICESDWQITEKDNASPSLDQIFGLMSGLLAVVVFSNDDALSNQAKAISSRLYNYAQRNFFLLKLPNGSLTARGHDVRGLSSLLHGLNKRITDEDLFSQSKIDVGITKIGLQGVASFWDSEATAQLIRDSAGEEIDIPVVGKIELKSFVLHIILMALSTSRVWSQNEVEQTSLAVNHHLSALLYCLYQPSLIPINFVYEDIQAILDACPDSGPNSSLEPVFGWHKDSRWSRSSKLDEASTQKGLEYNGLDWLMLHNAAQLVFFSR